MNKITYEERTRIYGKARDKYGYTAQAIVALEEMSEVQKEICKDLRGKGNEHHLAKEIADATIVLEQMRLFNGLDDEVCRIMDKKVKRLEARLNDAT
jgi:hypothetical protein